MFRFFSKNSNQNGTLRAFSKRSVYDDNGNVKKNLARIIDRNDDAEHELAAHENRGSYVYSALV